LEKEGISFTCFINCHWQNRPYCRTPNSY